MSCRRVKESVSPSGRTISGTVSRYPDWLSRVTPSAVMTAYGVTRAAVRTVISGQVDRDLPLIPAVARARTATVARPGGDHLDRRLP